jgi:uncharacterized protein YjbJ (UPF0337 family)
MRSRSDDASPGRVKTRYIRKLGVKCHPGGHWHANRHSSRGKETAMGLGDKIQNAGEEAAGKVKETTGRATDNRSLEAEGKADQASANIKQAGEKAKDAVKDALD